MLKLFKLTLICALALAAHAQIDPTIPLRVKTPQIQDPMETYRRAEEIRNLQLRNQQIQEQIRLQDEANRRAREAAPPTPQAPTLRPAMSTDRTLGILNGRFWQSASETARLYYLVGFNDATAALAKDDLRERVSAGSATFAEKMKFVDGFYADPANAAIPVLDALIVFTAKLNGFLPDSLEALTAWFRSETAKAQELAPAKQPPTLRKDQ